MPMSEKKNVSLRCTETFSFNTRMCTCCSQLGCVCSLTRETDAYCKNSKVSWARKKNLCIHM
jgi:hypothetical protein